jgi:hypothetical protein
MRLAQDSRSSMNTIGATLNVFLQLPQKVHLSSNLVGSAPMLQLKGKIAIINQ